MPLVYLVLALLLVAAVLAGLLWAGTLWLQGYFYNEPTGGLLWRAPAAAAAIVLFLAFWCFLNYRLGEPNSSELPLDTWWNFSPTETYPPRPWKEFWAVKDGKEILYQKRSIGSQGAYEYQDAQRKPWSRESNGIVQAIIVEEDGQKVRYNLDLPGGKFKPGEEARYVEDGGRHRVLTESDVRRGQLTRTRRGLFLGYVLLNVLFLGVCFAAVWLLLRFQWSHALGLGFVVWLALMLAIFPLLTDRTKQAVNQKEVPKATAWAGPAARRPSDSMGQMARLAL